MCVGQDGSLCFVVLGKRPVCREFQAVLVAVRSTNSKGSAFASGSHEVIEDVRLL